MAKDDPKATLVWGEGPKEMWSFGETLDIPDDYDFLPAGDAAKTRFVKANAEKYYIHMQRVKQGNRTIGVWAPKAIVEQAQDVTLKTTEEERAAKRQKKQEKEYEVARAEIRRQYPRIPDEDLEAVVERAFTVGYGTVGRTGQLSLEEKCRLAVAAHVRHNHTGYDTIRTTFKSREGARDQVRKKTDRILDSWRKR